MKNPIVHLRKTLAVAGTLILAFAGTTFAAENWQEIPADVTVPAAEEYVVLADAAWLADEKSKAEITAFAKRHGNAQILPLKFGTSAGTPIDYSAIWEPLAGTLKTLKSLRPRYIAAILKPENINRKTIGDLLTISRKLDANEDFHIDAIVGILTADSAGTLEKVLAENEKLQLKRAAGTTNFDLGRFERGFVILDWGGDQQYFLRENGETKLEKMDVPAKSVEFFGEQFEATNPQYFLTASHATEFNLEMPFSRGMIVPAGGKFWLLTPPEMWRFGAVMAGTFEPGNVKALAQNDEPKIWIAAGNCLIGDALGNANSMVVTALSHYGFRQFVGYTVPSWFGRGWDVHSYFFDGGESTQVGQAWLFCLEKTLLNLPEKARVLPIELRPEGMGMTSTATLNAALREAGANPTREMLGNMYDRDVIAFYGNPIFPVEFAGGKPMSVKLQRLAGTKKCRLEFSMKPTDGNTKMPICFWFPQRANAQIKPILRERGLDGNVKLLDSELVFTENFIMLTERYDFAAGTRLEIDFELAGTEN